jgi:predicted RNA-binding protein
MCEANVYFQDDSGKLDLYFENVDLLLPDDSGKIVLQNIFGHRKIVTAQVSELLLADRKIILKRKRPT